MVSSIDNFHRMTHVTSPVCQTMYMSLLCFQLKHVSLHVSANNHQKFYLLCSTLLVTSVIPLTYCSGQNEILPRIVEIFVTNAPRLFHRIVYNCSNAPRLLHRIVYNCSRTTEVHCTVVSEYV